LILPNRKRAVREGAATLPERVPGSARIELVADRDSRSPASELGTAFTDECERCGVSINLVRGRAGGAANCVRMARPLTIADDEIDLAVTIMHDLPARRHADGRPGRAAGDAAAADAWLQRRQGSCPTGHRSGPVCPSGHNLPPHGRLEFCPVKRETVPTVLQPAYLGGIMGLWRAVLGGAGTRRLGLVTVAAAVLVAGFGTAPPAASASGGSSHGSAPASAAKTRAVGSPISPALRDRSGRITGNMALTRDEVAHNLGVSARSGALPMDTTTDMTYHGGSVMRSPVNYAIFWQPSGTTFAAGYQAGLQRYFQDVGGTPFYNIVTQYGDNSGRPVPNAATFGGAWTDANAFPHAGTTSDALTDGDMQQAVSDAISANPSWQAPSLSTMYFVFLPQGVAQCSDSSDCFALPGQPNGKYCAYHSAFNGDTIYASMPYNGSATGCLDTAPYPNGKDVDSEIRVTSHEMIEANTDPQSDGWFDKDGLSGEIGDKCNFNYGTTYENGVNIVLHGDPYQIQTEWSNNAVRGCVKRYGADPVASVSGTLDFGTVPRGTSATKDVVVSNNGGGDLNILDIHLDPSSDPAYSLVNVPPKTATLAAGQSRTVTVRYSPPATSTTPGQANGSLTVDIDSPAPNDSSFTVSATSTTGVPHLVASPAQLAFGLVCGGAEVNQQLTVSNTGTAPLTISSVAAAPGSSPGLTVLPQPSLPLTLQPGGSVTFTVQFVPTGSGTISGSIVITSDDPNSPLSIPVTGTVGAPHLTLDTNVLRFGGVPVDDRTSPHLRTLPFIISNTGSCPLTLTSVTMSGANAADFSVVGPPPLPVNIAAGSDLTLSVSVNPSAAGDRVGTLSIDSTDPANPVVSASLSATGLIPAIGTAPPTLSFSPTVIASQVPGYLGTTLNDTVTNTGQAELIVDTLSTAAPFRASGPTSPPSRYAPSDGFTEPVTFNPTATGRFTGGLTIADGNPEAPVSRTVGLCGEGVQRGIRLLVVNGNGTPYATVDRLKLESHGTSVHVVIQASALPISPVPTSCIAGQQRHYENQNLPATDTTNQRGSYYALDVSAGGKSTSVVFTLAPTEFKELVVTVK
jgi:hypothetical protein